MINMSFLSVPFFIAMFNQLIFLQNTCSSDEEDAEILEESPCKQWTRNEKTWKNLARQILDALSYLHSFEPPIVHANLTCNSVFILQNEQVKIGCVAPKTIHHHVETLRENVKNAHYLAPECDNQTETTIQADIYSFGVCALEMATTGALQSGCFNGASNAASVSLPPHAASALSSASASSSTMPATMVGSNGLPSTMTTGPPPASCSHVVITKEMVYKALNSLDQQPEQKHFIERCLELDPARRANVTELLALLDPPELDPELQQQMAQPGTSAATTGDSVYQEDDDIFCLGECKSPAPMPRVSSGPLSSRQKKRYNSVPDPLASVPDHLADHLVRKRTIELENERLRIQIGAVQEQVATLTNDNTRLQIESDTAQSLRHQLSREVMKNNAAVIRMHTTKVELDSARVDLNLARLRHKNELETVSNDHQTHIQQRDGQIAQLTKELEKAAQLQKELETASKDHQTHIQQRDDEIARLKKELETASKDHQTHIQQRDDEIARLKKELETASKDHQTHIQQRDDEIAQLQDAISLLTVAKQHQVKAQLDAEE